MDRVGFTSGALANMLPVLSVRVIFTVMFRVRSQASSKNEMYALGLCLGLDFCEIITAEARLNLQKKLEKCSKKALKIPHNDIFFTEKMRLKVIFIDF